MNHEDHKRYSELLCIAVNGLDNLSPAKALVTLMNTFFIDDKGALMVHEFATTLAHAFVNQSYIYRFERGNQYNALVRNVMRSERIVLEVAKPRADKLIDEMMTLSVLADEAIQKAKDNHE